MMRYSEIPNEFSTDDIKFVAFSDDYFYERSRNNPLESKNPSLHSCKRNGTLPSPNTITDQLAGINMNPSELKYGRIPRVSLCLEADPLRRENSGKESNHATNTCHNKSSHTGKTQSLPPNTSIKYYDSVILSALCVPAEDLAKQITLLDLPAFVAIMPDELTGCGWTKKNKHDLAPNIVMFTKRFNHTSFWTVQEILSEDAAKQRAEIMTHFIKVAKKLYDLNNLHSLFAIISALQSASIFRLKKTWAMITKKDKQTFERLADIFNDNNNWERLREYLDSLRVPCIPYLGLFLTDLVYIDIAHPHSGGMETEQRKNKMNNILRIIANYQQSDYSYVQPSDDIQNYLKSIRYIEELQNIFEEEQYKKSLRLEPLSSVPSSSSCSSKESFNVDTPGIACLNLSPAKTIGSLRITSTSSSKFIPTHRKCRSLGSKFRSTSLPRNFEDKCPVITITSDFGTMSNKRCKCRIFGKSNLNQTSSQYCVDGTEANQARHLLDDSVIESNAIVISSCDALSIASSEDGTNNPIEGDKDVLINDNQYSFQGCVRRKTFLKNGRRPAVASWQRYWMQIWANSLVYFAPKSFKGSERNDFKHEPCKVCPLDGWTTRRVDNPKHKNTFELVNLQIGTVYRFRTDCPQTSISWLHKIRMASEKGSQKPTSINLMSFE